MIGPTERMHVLKSTLCTVVVASMAMISSACSTIVMPRADPLLDRIIRASDRQEVSRHFIYEVMAEAQVVYLGETHDNSRHHQIQLEILEELLRLGKQPALGFETFSLEQTGFLMHYAVGKPSPFTRESSLSEEGILRKNLGWGKERDWDWQFYFPLLRLAKEHKMAVFGADLPTGIRLRLSRVGLDGLSALERSLLHPTAFKNPAYRNLMYHKFTTSHCGWSSPELLKKLYETWLARNDAMAAAIVEMVKDQRGQPVVMVLGAGHVQYNMGVYERVAHLLPGVLQVNLGLREIAIEPLTLNEYVKTTRRDGTIFPPEHEYFWFTPRVSYEDPCKRFKDYLKRKDADE